MSEPIPESIPTSHDPRSKRPTKRLALTSTGQQASQLSALFAKPDHIINLPTAETSTKIRGLAPPPEIVANVQGSSAGAGSGEFHVYKASRRREYERLRLMDEEVKHEKENEEFEKAKVERRMKDEVKTNKNKARREKMKAKKKGKSEDRKDKETDGEDRLPSQDDDPDKTPKPGANNITPGSNDNSVERHIATEETGVTIHDDD
ncbi:hypothetical protein MMC19_007235 [Ptychographa xylographoides]|nr:hypothetical protein [Ptychographa xylographoides]